MENEGPMMPRTGMGKLRCDSAWAALAPEQRETLEVWWFEENPGKIGWNQAEQYAEQNRACSAWFRLVPHNGPKKNFRRLRPDPDPDIGCRGCRVGNNRRV